MRKVGQANVSTPFLSLFPRKIPRNGICNSRQLPGNRALSFGYPNMVHFLPTNIYKPILWISLIWFLDAAICDWRKRGKETNRDYSGWQKPFQPALVEMFPVRSQLLVDQVLMLKSCFFFQAVYRCFSASEIHSFRWNQPKKKQDCEWKLKDLVRITRGFLPQAGMGSCAWTQESWKEARVLTAVWGIEPGIGHVDQQLEGYQAPGI